MKTSTHVSGIFQKRNMNLSHILEVPGEEDVSVDTSLNSVLAGMAQNKLQLKGYR